MEGKEFARGKEEARLRINRTFERKAGPGGQKSGRNVIAGRGRRRVRVGKSLECGGEDVMVVREVFKRKWKAA